MEAYEAEFNKVGGWIVGQGQQRRLLSRSEDPQAAFSPESSDTSATEPGGHVFTHKR